MARRPRRARDEQHAAGILVEPVDELGPVACLVGKAVEQPVEMLVRARPALRR